MNILAISGSLRSGSYNLIALQALEAIAPSSIQMEFAQIGHLPLFNPDLEKDNIRSVVKFKNGVKHANGLVIASPEYAHGISGPMKNALDWLVSGLEFLDKPIMLINTSPRSSHAQEALKEVLLTMSGNIIDEACVAIPLLGSDLNRSSILKNEKMVSSLVRALDEFVIEIKQLPN